MQLRSVQLSVKVVLLLALMLAAACERVRGDRIIQRVETPFPLAIKEHLVPEPVPCDEVGWRKVKCLFRPSRAKRCLYGTTGDAINDPTPRDCYTMAGEPHAFHISEEVSAPPPDDPVELFFDAEGTRLLVHQGTSATLVLFSGQAVLAQSFGKRSADPRAVLARPRFEALSEFFWELQPEPRRHALDLIRDGGGDPGVRQLLLNSLRYSTEDEWAKMMASLPAADQRIVAAAAIDAALGPRDAGPDFQLPEAASAAMIWLVQHPEHQPEDLRSRALAQAAREIEKPTLLLDFLAARGEPIAGEAACKFLKEWAASREPDVRSEPDVQALYVLSVLGNRCDAVGAALSALACHSEIRCGDGPLAPVCTPAQARAGALESMRSYEPSDAGPSELPLHWGRLSPVIAAAAAQGPLPASFVQHDKRRRYRAVNLGCTPDAEELAQAACEAPLDNHSIEVGGCAVAIDDRAQTLTARPR